MRRSFVRLTSIALLIFPIIWLAAARAQKTLPPTQDEIARAKAVEAARVINAAEYDFRKNYGHFAAWPQVYNASAVKDLLSNWPRIQELSLAPSDEVIPGFRLTMLVGEEGTAYSIALREMKGHGCGISVFSDQSGLIYEGRVVDCPQIVDRPEPISR